MASKEILIDIRKIVRIGNQPAVTISRGWLKENGGRLGDRALIRLELLKGANDIKLIKKSRKV